MAIQVFNRAEKKYIVDYKTMRRLTEEFSGFMEEDSYNKTGRYSISNIYLDTPDSLLIRKSIEKPVFKQKLRLRAYGVPDITDKSYLEIKRKLGGTVYKRRTQIRLDDAYSFIESGRFPPERKNILLSPLVLNEEKGIIESLKLVPTVYIRYDRLGFYKKDSPDFRVTFDSNIRTRRYDLRLEKGDYGEPLLKSELFILEVKAEKGIPLEFARLLSENKIYPASFSKYGEEYKKFILKSLKKGCVTA
ncbi:MAG: polyphosphate polymerase domain-containing protein [Acutalibacteraceae bacterium]